MPRRDDIETILILGSGPIVIGQGCEFDYSGTQACKALTEEGFRVVLVNSNPATIMTDPMFSDRTYIEPITPEAVRRVIEKEKSNGTPIDALLPTLGGQTALNCACELYDEGVLTEFSILREIRDGIPVVDTRRAISTVEAENGETIFLGGLITQENTNRQAGIPILRSIPGIGFLFGEKKTRTVERELVIVIRPTIKPKGVLSLVLSDAVSDDYGLVLDEFSEWSATAAKEHVCGAWV